MNGAVLQLAAKSLFNRRLSAILTVLAVALSTALFLGVEKTRTGAKAGFESTISETDLIVGARSGAINLLLYSVFRIGDPTANISWESYQLIDTAPGVAWTIPVSLGDSHRGYRVMGTTNTYFDRYRTGRDRPLAFAQGGEFNSAYDVVLGAETASALGYGLGDEIIVSHGVGDVSFSDHDEHPFTVVGVLEPTGTPVDRTVHVPLEGIELMHGAETHDSPDDHSEDAEDHAEDAEDHAEHGDDHGAENGDNHAGEHDDDHDDIPALGDPRLQPDQLTAVFLGLDSPTRILSLQRQINTYEGEALNAVVPGVALVQLWSVIGAAEQALLAISVFVVAVGLVSVLVSLSSSVNERRREMAILRAVGARPGHVFALMVSESALLAFVGAFSAVVLVNLGFAALGDFAMARYGLSLGAGGPGLVDLAALAAITIAGALIGALPAWRALRNSLADGLSIRL
jgi:putative ABC transport system permease protein